MKHGHECIKPMQAALLAFMVKHQFETLADFKGRSLEYLTTHADLVQRQKARVVKRDGEWTGEGFVRQSDALSR
jgi:hypothetical protein